MKPENENINEKIFSFLNIKDFANLISLSKIWKKIIIKKYIILK